jgi:hypothetical protein
MRRVREHLRAADLARAGRGFFQECSRKHVRVPARELELRCDRPRGLDVELLSEVSSGGAPRVGARSRTAETTRKRILIMAVSLEQRPFRQTGRRFGAKPEAERRFRRLRGTCGPDSRVEDAWDPDIRVVRRFGRPRSAPAAGDSGKVGGRKQCTFLSAYQGRSTYMSLPQDQFNWRFDPPSTAGCGDVGRSRAFTRIVSSAAAGSRRGRVGGMPLAAPTGDMPLAAPTGELPGTMKTAVTHRFSCAQQPGMPLHGGPEPAIPRATISVHADGLSVGGWPTGAPAHPDRIRGTLPKGSARVLV